MNYAKLIKTASDLSEASLEDALAQLGKPTHFTIIAGIKNTEFARVHPAYFIAFNLEWNYEWAVSIGKVAVFSEGAIM